MYWINLSVRAYICYEADEDQRHRLAIYSVSRPADNKSGLLTKSSLRSCQTKANIQNPQPKKSGRTTSSLRDELLACCKASSEMMRWQKKKMLYNMGAAKHSTNGMNSLRLPLQCPLISVFLCFFFQFCRLQTLAGHFFHFFQQNFLWIYIRKTTISRFFF